MKKNKKNNLIPLNSKDNVMEFNGFIDEALPSALFRVVCENGDKQHIVLATISGKLRINNIRLVPGDSVLVEVSCYDLTKGRIVWRK